MPASFYLTVRNNVAQDGGGGVSEPWLKLGDGVWEGGVSWRGGLDVPPEIAAVDGTTGVRTALEEVFPAMRHPRCWGHKAANVLNKLPKSMYPAVKADLREIRQAETRAAAEAALDTFAESAGPGTGRP